MSNEQLRAQLEQLHAELRLADALDPQQRKLLQTLADDIQRLLNSNESQPHHYRSLGERLSENMAELEASHPQITLMMRQTIDSLTPLGI
jgi:hypothetical protein